MRRILIALGLLLIAAGVMAQTVQERYTYQRTVLPEGGIRYTETYEKRAQDVDDSTFHTVQKTVTVIPDKAARIAQMQAEKAALVAQAQALQTRIDALTALP